MVGAVITALVIGVIVGAAVMWWAPRAQAGGPDTAVPIGEIRNQLAITAGQVQDLAAIFANAQQRGRAGEVVLENLLEATGMARHRDYEAQASADGARPDVVLNLAGRGRLVIDAKFPLDDYRRAAAATGLDCSECSAPECSMPGSRSRAYGSGLYWSRVPVAGVPVSPVQ
jgi:RmuC family